MELQSLCSLRFHVFAPQWEAGPWLAPFEQNKNKTSKESISMALGLVWGEQMGTGSRGSEPAMALRSVWHWPCG